MNGQRQRAARRQSRASLSPAVHFVQPRGPAAATAGRLLPDTCHAIHGQRQRTHHAERDAVISVFDHGFLYGEGIYETMRTYHGRLFLYDRHVRRLRHSAQDDRARPAIHRRGAGGADRGDDRQRPRSTARRRTFACSSRAASASSTYDPSATPHTLDDHHREAAGRSAAGGL